MKQVLIFSPRFPPASAPDYHRVRMMLPLLEDLGWKAVVLCVDSRYVDGECEPDLLQTLPPALEIVRCRAISAKWTRRVGVGSLSLRAGFFLRSAGDRLLRERAFDLVFFSTTEFPLLTLGPRWQRKFRVPYVIDLQDPWVNPYYRDNNMQPPGGHLKNWVHQMAARRSEGKTLKAAAQIVTVSPQYGKTLTARYPALAQSSFSVIPFGGAARDFEVARVAEPGAAALSFGDGRRHWLYAGAVVPGMSKSLTGFFNAMKSALDSGILPHDSVRVHFIGTDYAPLERVRHRVLPLAKQCGVERYVSEQPERMAYLETIRCLLEARALLMFGSDEVGYTASKLVTYILARKPLLTIFHEASSVTRIAAETKAAVVVGFRSTTSGEELAADIYQQWFASRAFDKKPETDWLAVEPYTAEAMTRSAVEVFDRALVAGRHRDGKITSLHQAIGTEGR
jgi:hypothetical protein